MILARDTAQKLAQFLVEARKLSIQNLRQAETASTESGRGLIDLLIENGHASEEGIVDAIREQLRLPLANAVQFDTIPKDAINSLSTQFILQNRIVPIAINDAELTVALSEPSALNQINGIRTLVNRRVMPSVIRLSEMDSLLTRLDPREQQAPLSSAGLGDRDSATPQGTQPSRNRKPAPQEKPAPTPSMLEQGQHEVINFVNKLLTDAVTIKASDIHLEPYKDRARTRLRIDGVLLTQAKQSEFLFEHYPAVSTRIKIMANLDIAERRLTQDGAIVLTLPNGNEVDFRVSVLPTNFGERIVLRILDRNAMSLDLESLGFPPLEMERFTHAVDAAQGLVLVTGPTGSGKTTTLYGAMRRLNQPDVNILTAEDPIEFSIEGLGQVHIREDIGLTFSAALRSFLRQDPEIILVGEIRDKETADISIKAALTGHLVLSTLHTNDAISTITRLINMGIPGYLIASSLSAVVGQRLARRTCPKCKDIDLTCNEKILTSIGFDPGVASRLRAQKGKGCEHCAGTGYKGRIGIYEVLSISERLRAAITADADLATLKEIAHKDGFRDMQHNGRELIVQGTLSIEEYGRNLVFN